MFSTRLSISGKAVPLKSYGLVVSFYHSSNGVFRDVLFVHGGKRKNFVEKTKVKATDAGIEWPTT